MKSSLVITCEKYVKVRPASSDWGGMKLDTCTSVTGCLGVFIVLLIIPRCS